MIKAKLTYSFKDRKSFENKVLPYIFGKGIFYRKGYSVKHKDKKIEFIIQVKSLSQLITASTGMLRYSPGSKLEEIRIIKTEPKKLPKNEYENLNEIILGAILKPSLLENPAAIKKIVKFSIENNLQFVKDDDASDYSKKEATKIKKLMGNLPYFQKISNENSLISKHTMIVPWVDGWELSEKIGKKAIIMVHCANLSPQISWNSQIIFSRVAGASFAIVPDSLFDKTFNLFSSIKTAKQRIKGLKPIKLIVSGGINPKRIIKIKNSLKREDYRSIGFAIGSWILNKN